MSTFRLGHNEKLPKGKQAIRSFSTGKSPNSTATQHQAADVG